MKPSLVVFDMAGTTVDDADGVNRCLRAALEHAGLSVSRDEVNAVMGIAKPVAIRLLAQDAKRDDLIARIEPIHADFIARMKTYYRENPKVQPVDGAEETFRRLMDAEIHVALNTGFTRDIVDVLLERLKWESIPSITSDEVESSRPEPEMIQTLMRRFSLSEPERVAKVGDTPADLQEGANAGCGWIVGVTGGTHTLAQLQPHPHTHLIESVAEIPALFGI